MKQQTLHTPEGVRDIYGAEYRKKLIVEEKLQNTLHLYGYQDIQTPLFEYFDVFGKEIGTIPSKELYKFFDRDGNTLVLRPDMTPSIARVVATVFDTDMPVRLCYKGNTFINHTNYQGRLRENTQQGAELVGVDSAEADAEMIAMAVESLKAAGLEDFQIHIGNVDFFEGLIGETHLDEEDELRLRELIRNRNYFGVDELLKSAEKAEAIKTAFQMLPELVGGIEILKEANQVALNFQIVKALKRLEEIYEVLVAYGVEKYVAFDLSMNGTYRYYTGIIFRGYTYGTGGAIVKGGRYDGLLEKFGKSSPSVGFVIAVDELMTALGRQKIDVPYQHEHTMILYDEAIKFDAVALAKKLREDHTIVEIVQKELYNDVYQYCDWAKQNLCSKLIYMKKNQETEEFDLTAKEA